MLIVVETRHLSDQQCQKKYIKQPKNHKSWLKNNQKLQGVFPKIIQNFHKIYFSKFQGIIYWNI